MVSALSEVNLVVSCHVLVLRGKVKKSFGAGRSSAQGSHMAS